MPMKCEYPYCQGFAIVFHENSGKRVCRDHRERLIREVQKADNFRKSRWEPPV